MMEELVHQVLVSLASNQTVPTLGVVVKALRRLALNVKREEDPSPLERVIQAAHRIARGPGAGRHWWKIPPLIRNLSVEGDQGSVWFAFAGRPIPESRIDPDA